MSPAATRALAAFSDTFAGIAPASVLPFIGAQLVGAALGWVLVRAFFPAAPASSVSG